jgi:hypothetical protein
MKQGMTLAAMSALLDGDVENFIAASTPGGIEAQEARGQKTFVNTATLPKDMGAGTREKLESIGFVFGKDADDLFVHVEMPNGWTKKATDHSMWTDLLDDKGRRRAQIFYKAAFYDRSAHMSLRGRFWVRSYESCNAHGETVDYGKPDHTHNKVEIMDVDSARQIVGVYDRNGAWDKKDALAREATLWLDTNFPNWLDPMAYWD